MRLRLLFFISSLTSGGAERVTANLANYWAAKGWDITVVTLSDCTNDFYELSPSVRRIGLGLMQESANSALGLINNLLRVRALRRALIETKPQVALAMMDKANILLSLATWRLANIVPVGSERIHPPQFPLGSLWESLRSFCYGQLAAVTALTNESHDWLLHHTAVKKVTVIPNAAPWPVQSHAPLLMPQAIIPPSRKLLLAIGRLSSQKGFDLLIEAFVQISAKHSDWHLAILGEGHLRAALYEKIKEAELEEHITLVGRAGNVGDWYKAADLFVMSSRFEGFPNALAEALAYGLPAVSFDCDCGPRVIIRHQVDGLLVPKGDVASLAASLDQLMSNPAMRQAFGSKAIECRQRFSMQKITRMWECLFTELINES
jgi:glycosyltransferase involved in cell wall biosynthesis